MDEKKSDDSSKNIWPLVIPVIIIGLAVWFVMSMIGRSASTDYSKTWWSGDTTVLVCKMPYSHTSSCYSVTANSNNGYLMSVTIDQKLFSASDTECFEGASDGIKQACRFTDESGQRWEILPIGSSF